MQAVMHHCAPLPHHQPYMAERQIGMDSSEVPKTPSFSNIILHRYPAPYQCDLYH